MAIIREEPKCPFCGESIAEAKYRDQSHIPINSRIIGDTFEGWNYKKHKCEKEQEFKDGLPIIRI